MIGPLNEEETKRAKLVKKLGSLNDEGNPTIRGNGNKKFSKLLLASQGRKACTTRMAVAVRDVILTRFFKRNDWGSLDKVRHNSKLSRFNTWPKNFFT